MAKTMVKLFAVFTLVLIAGLVVIALNNRTLAPVAEQQDITFVSLTEMKLSSSAFEHNQNLPDEFTCEGDGINPPLAFSEVPEGAVSLALILDDPDAPNGDFVHWLLWNIPLSIEGIERDSVPEGTTEGITSFGTKGYGPPCPPAGTHRYTFKLYALDRRLELTESADKSQLMEAMNGHALAETQLIGLYSRN